MFSFLHRLILSKKEQSTKTTAAKSLQVKEFGTADSKRQENINISKGHKDNNPGITLSDVIAILAMIAAFFSVYMSWHTNQINIEATEKYRLESEHYQRLELNRALDIKTNVEYWDYTIDLLVENLVNRYGLTEQLWNIASLVSSKQSSAALSYTEELEPQIGDDGEFYLLKCCVILRNYVVEENCLYDNFDGRPLLQSLNSALENNIDTKYYSITIGIINFYLQDWVNSAKYLKHAIEMYDCDSPFYSVANYWLALVSVNINHCICDYDNFLDSTFQDDRTLQLLKSALCFITKDYTLDEPVRVYVSSDLNTSFKGGIAFVNAPSLDPAQFLENDTEDPGSTSPYYAYKMIYDYTYYISLIGQYQICPTNNLDDVNVKLSEMARTGYRSVPLCSIILDPKNEVGLRYTYIKHKTQNVVIDDLEDLASRFYNDLFSMYMITPYEVILDRCISLSHLRETENGVNYDWIFSSFCKRASIYPEISSSGKGLYALIALKYSSYKDESTDLDKYDAAKCAYFYGYRYDFVYAALIDYYQQVGDQAELERLKSEIEILGLYVA